MAKIEIKVPDIGDFKNVPIVEILVKPGDAVTTEQSLITIESDKATMDVPAPSAGVVGEILVKVGDKVSEGTALLTLDSAAAVAGGADPGNSAADAACRHPEIAARFRRGLRRPRRAPVGP